MTLTNIELASRYKKYLRLKFEPLGMYFSKNLPEGKIREQGKVINRCIVSHIFKAAKKGGSSVIKKGQGCPGGQYWSGMRKKLPWGWAYFITHGHKDVLGGRAERFKKNTKIAVEVIKDPGPIKLPEDVNYIIFRPLKEIPNNQNIEYVLIFANPKIMAKLITLTNYARNLPYLVTAPSGSGCMSVINFPLNMEKDKPDAVMGIWDPFAREGIPKYLLTLAVRRWFAEDMALDMPESFLGHTPPFTFKGEIRRLFKK